MHRTTLICLTAACLTACGGDGKSDTTATGSTSVTTTGDSTATDGGTTTDPTTTTSDPTSDGTTGGTTGGSTSSDTASFLGMPDGGGASECDIWTQDCSDGEKCAPWANDGGNSWNATKCVPEDANPKAPGDECMVEGSDVTGLDDCQKGSLCFSVNPETGVGLCVPMCEGSETNPSCADPDQTCNISNNGSLILCLDNCNPLLQDCQTGGQPQGCYPVNDSFLCWPDFSFDLGAYGDPCEYFNVCDPGLYCAAADVVPDCQGASGCCTEYCDTTDANVMCSGTAGGAECVPWWDQGQAPPGQETLGACILPP